MKNLFNEQYFATSEDCERISNEFIEKLDSWIRELLNEYNPIELEYLLKDDLTLMFARHRFHISMEKRKVDAELSIISRSMSNE